MYACNGILFNHESPRRGKLSSFGRRLTCPLKMETPEKIDLILVYTARAHTDFPLRHGSRNRLPTQPRRWKGKCIAAAEWKYSQLSSVP